MRTEGEASPEPRTTHNSVHSRLSFLENLLPEETSAMAGAERGWGLGEWVSCVCQSTRRGLQTVRAPGGTRGGVRLCQGGAALSPGRGDLCFRGLCSASLLGLPLLWGQGACRTEATPPHHCTLIFRVPRKGGFCPHGCQPESRPCMVLVPGSISGA